MTRSERGQMLVLLVGAALALMLAAGALAALGGALLDRGGLQRAADLAAVSAARSMRDDLPRLLEPSWGGDRLPQIGTQRRTQNGRLIKSEYLARARRAALEAARLNGASTPGDVEFPDAGSFAPLRVRVRLGGRARVRIGGGRRDDEIDLGAAAEAQVTPAQPAGLEPAAGGGYPGPFAYRQGKPMRPDVAVAFDRMEVAARRDGVALVIVSAYRSDAEQARLFAQHPDPRWVAPPGHSLHRNATELDLGPPAAYGWLARNSGRFHFLRRYAWEPWHYETSLASYRK